MTHYYETHIYATDTEAGCVIGATEYGIDQMGEIVNIDIPQVGRLYKQGETFCVLESVKAVQELIMPFDAICIETFNDASRIAAFDRQAEGGMEEGEYCEWLRVSCTN